MTREELEKALDDLCEEAEFEGTGQSMDNKTAEMKSEIVYALFGTHGQTAIVSDELDWDDEV